MKKLKIQIKKFYNFLSFLIFFCIIFIIYDLYKSNYKDIKDISKFCQEIEKIEFFNNYFLLFYRLKIEKEHLLIFQNNFEFHTSTFGQELIFPSSSIKVLNTTSYIINFTYNFPIIQIYKGEFICKFDLEFKYFLNFEILSFLNHNQSQIKCFGDSFINRYCESKNIIFFKNNLFFYTDMIFQFPSPFLSLSGYPPPSDPQSNHLYDQPIVTSENPFLLSHINFTKINEISYLFGRFHNIVMLWHLLYDTVIPLYRTINLIENSIFNKNRRFFIKDMYNFPYNSYFYDCMSLYSTEHNLNYKNNYFFSHLILGLKKFEANSLLTRSSITSFDFKYNFSNINITNYKELIFQHFNILNSEPNLTNPQILILLRKSKSRNIINIQEIINYINNTCLFCQIKAVFFESLSIKQQIEFSSNSTIIIGAHGSGLSNVLWLKNSNKTFKSYLIELLPYNYWCRDWYESASNLTNVIYKKIESKRIENNDEKCFESKELCLISNCHDLLRDQSILIEINYFINIFNPILEKFKVFKTIYSKE